MGMDKCGALPLLCYYFVQFDSGKVVEIRTNHNNFFYVHAG